LERNEELRGKKEGSYTCHLHLQKKYSKRENISGDARKINQHIRQTKKEVHVKKIHEDKRTMFSAVLTLLEQNQQKVSGVTGFSTSVAAFKSLLEKIDLKAKEKDEATAGKTAQKHAAEELLIPAVMQVSSALFLHARMNEDYELRGKTDFRESTLTRMRDTDLATKTESILALAKQYAKELEAYGVTAQEITDLENKIQAYREALGKSASSIPERKGARETMEGLIREADEVLEEELDRYMERLRTSEPEFYFTYCDATYIRLTGIRHEKTTAAAPVQQPVMAK
jgi:hypothetical protein